VGRQGLGSGYETLLGWGENWQSSRVTSFILLMAEPEADADQTRRVLDDALAKRYKSQ